MTKRIKATFKNVLCRATFPATLGYMSHEARKSCLRHGDHKGPHRNRYFEWDQGLPFPSDWSLLRERKRNDRPVKAGRS